jgi:3-oxoacyl-[acyl-carrier-protein] synthase II
VIAAADYPRLYKSLWFKNLNMYATDGKIKPFDQEANGFVLGDGGVGLVLESLDHAIERNAHIYAEYKGGAFLMEGWKVAFPDVTDNVYQQAIESALQQANWAPQEIDLLCAHGVGSKIIDRYEAKAITNVFGPYPSKPLITALKPYLGHNLGGSALLETAVSLLAMENNLVPPVLNTSTIHHAIEFQPVRTLQSVPLSKMMKICSAFAGFNAASIFEKIEV